VFNLTALSVRISRDLGCRSSMAANILGIFSQYPKVELFVHFNVWPQSSEPCIRGHRATSCAHTDRILLEVRKPGRPLESCGHEFATCNCGKITELLSMGTGTLELPAFLQRDVFWLPWSSSANYWVKPSKRKSKSSFGANLAASDTSNRHSKGTYQEPPSSQQEVQE